MEDDNALDIIKWLFKDGTKVDCESILVRLLDNEPSEWEVKLRGNLLVMKPVSLATVPQLIVCEKIALRKCDNDPTSFYIKYGEEETRFTAASEAEAEMWLIKLATCSHQMVKAELDQAMHQYYMTTQHGSTEIKSIDSGTVFSYFLTTPFRKELSFNVYQSVGVPNRKIVCCETMYESKLSLIIPLDMVKLSIRWASDLRDDLLGALWSARNGAILEALHTAVRHLNSNIEIYTQATEFLDGYAGPAFRPSAERFRMVFASMPTNLHAQFFEINGAPAGHFLTCGATAAAPLRFVNGGLFRIRNKFVTGLEPSALDFINEFRFYSRRKTLLSIKRQIGELTRRIDRDWHVTKFGTVDKVGVQIFSEIKQLHETVYDIAQSFPNISNLVDALCEGGYVQLGQHQTLPDALSNQLDSLDASMISLTSKMAVIDSINDDSKGRESFEESAKVALNFTLDALLHVVESILLAQLLSLIVACRRSTDCQQFFGIQLRHDLLLSQAVTIVSTALLTMLQTQSAEQIEFNLNTPLVSYFSFLSCYGDERGMIEDMFEIWTNFYNYVQFRFIPANSTVSQTCVPQIEGYRTSLLVSIPLCQSLFQKLPKNLSDNRGTNNDVASGGGSGSWFRVQTIFWNIGINHEATLACSLGDISVEETVNKTALSHLQQLVSKRFLNRSGPSSPAKEIIKNTATSPETIDEQQSEDEGSATNTAVIQGMLADLKKMVTSNPSRKNVAIFPRVIALTNTLGGINVISCKSGKDRTAMAVTLEEGRLLKETCGITQQQVAEMVDCLRKDGVRRENCRKNIGKTLYSFSPFQMHFLPKEYRPPNGTYAQKVAS